MADPAPRPDVLRDADPTAGADIPANTPASGPDTGAERGEVRPDATRPRPIGAATHGHTSRGEGSAPPASPA